MTTKEIGQHIRKYRQLKKMTMKELAEALGYENLQFIYSVETGRSKLPLESLAKACDILGINKKMVRAKLLNAYTIKLEKMGF